MQPGQLGRAKLAASDLEEQAAGRRDVGEVARDEGRDPLRDEAILVVTFISDDENVEDLNTAQQTYDALVAAKGGDADRIVMLGLIPGVGCGPGGLHWAQLIGLFGPHGIQGEVCSPDFNGFFQDAVTTILDACVINPG